MVEDLESKLTGALKESSNTNNLRVAEEANVYESITAESKASNETENDIKDEQKTKSYEEKTKIDIENINTIENRNKLYDKQWRTIYEVIQPDFFKETDIFPDDFI